MERDMLLAVLASYRAVQRASWPTLNPGIEERARRWPGMSNEDLAAEVTRLIDETNRPDCAVRVFWKHGPDFTYGGCNDKFAQDAGYQLGTQLIGKNDFEPSISWLRQASKYRFDDLEVVKTGNQKLDIIERQRSANGNIWLRTGKAPIRPQGGAAVGIYGMYEVIDVETAIRLNPALRG